jgi:hypothetical protein
MTTTQTYIMWRETIGCIPVYNRLSPGLQPLTIGSVLKIRFYSSRVP